jgi:hypothetical protein
VNSVLKQLSLIAGAVVFFLMLLLGILSHDGVTWPVLFRAIMGFFITAITFGIFFRFFAGVLYNFVLDKMEETKRQTEELETEPPPSEEET